MPCWRAAACSSPNACEPMASSAMSSNRFNSCRCHIQAAGILIDDLVFVWECSGGSDSPAGISARSRFSSCAARSSSRFHDKDTVLASGAAIGRDKR